MGKRQELVYLETQQELLDEMARQLERWEAGLREQVKARGTLGGSRLG